MPEQRLWGLGFLALIIHWLEEFILLISGPAILLGFIIGLVDLLTAGQLFLDMPNLLIGWAIAQGIGADGQFIGVWSRLNTAWRRERKDWGAILATVLLGSALAYIMFLGGLIFTYQQTYHISVNAALAQLGMDTVSWIWQRVGLSVVLGVSYAFLRYKEPKKDTRSLDEKKQEMQEEAELAALRQQIQGQKLAGVVGIARMTAQAVRGQKPTEGADLPALPAPSSQAKLPAYTPAAYEDTSTVDHLEFYTQSAPTQREHVHAAPKPAKPRPGTKAFRDLVYRTAHTLFDTERLSIFNIAQALTVDAAAVEDAIRFLQSQREGALKPGQELAPDAVLDALRVAAPVPA